MKDKELLLLSFIVSVIGLLIFFVFYSSASPEKIDISKLNGKYEGKRVVVEGRISKIKIHEEGHIFITLKKDNSKVIIPVFSEYAKKLNEKCKIEGNYIRVEGRVKLYRGNLEVVPEWGNIKCWKYYSS